MPAPIFGKYEIIKRLAVGGMGEVFLARQTGIPGFERHSILKSLLPDVAEQAGAIDEFLDEARVAATLNHPNVVSIYEVGLWENIYYIAMEFIDGENLAGLRKAALACGQFVPFEVTARIIRDAADGLDHAHKAKDMTGKAMEIVHRDISPQNIMVRRDGVTKVVDFGIARAANRSTRTKTGMTKGKLAYMPPEQVRGLPVDGRSDQFALGVVFWELLTGQRLFQHESDVELMKLVLRAQIPRPADVDSSIPVELESIVMQMLQPDPNSRFPSCHDAANSLAAWLEKVAPGLGTAEVSQFVVAVYDAYKAQTDSPTKPNQNFVIDLQSGNSGPNKISTGPHNSQSGLPAAGAGALGTGASADEPVTTVKPRLAPPGERPTPSKPSFLAGSTPAPTPIASPPAPPKRTGLYAGLGVAALVVVGGLGAVLTHKDPVPLPPVIVTAPVIVKPPEPVTPPPSTLPKEPEKPAPLLPAKLSIRSDPSGAEVLLAGGVLGTTPLDTDKIPPETDQELEIRKAGFRAEKRTVKLDRGANPDLVVRLAAAASKSHPVAAPVAATAPPIEKPAPAAGELKYGYLSVNTNPFTSVKIDGDVYGSTPLFKKKLSVGTHQVDMVNDGANIHWTKTVSVKAEDITKLTLP